MAMRTLIADPMLRLLLLAVIAAALLPAIGEARDVANLVVNGAIFLLFLLNGMRVPRGEIARGIANWRFLLPLLLWVFGAMALAGLVFSIAGAQLMPPLIAIGFLYLGALPSTVQSATSYTSLAGGNIGLSVVGAALLNIAGIFLTVPIFLALGGMGEGSVAIETIERIALILLLPFVIGQAVQGWTSSFIQDHKAKIVWVDRFVIALAVYVAFSGAVEQGIWSRVDPLAWAGLALLVGLFLVFGNWGAWLAGGALGLARADRIAFLFAGAQKSVAIGAPLAAILFEPDVAGFVVVPLLLYHLFQLVVAAPIAARLAGSETAAAQSRAG